MERTFKEEKIMKHKEEDYKNNQFIGVQFWVCFYLLFGSISISISISEF